MTLILPEPDNEAAGIGRALVGHREKAGLQLKDRDEPSPVLS